jgi:hypothetical protein
MRPAPLIRLRSPICCRPSGCNLGSQAAPSRPGNAQMIYSKHRYVPRMKIAVRAMLPAMAVVNAPVTLSVSAPPQAQAIGPAIPSYCHRLANAYRGNPNVTVPMYCMDSMWMLGVLPRGYVPHDAPPGYFYWPCCDPPPDSPPPRPPGNQPRVPDEPGDAPPPPDAPGPPSP